MQGLISPLSFPELIRITKPGGFIMWNIATGYEHYGRDYAKYEHDLLNVCKKNLITKNYGITVLRIVLHIHQPYFYTEHKLSLFTFDRYDDIIMDLVRERRCVRLSHNPQVSYIYNQPKPTNQPYKTTKQPTKRILLSSSYNEMFRWSFAVPLKKHSKMAFTGRSDIDFLQV